MEATPPLSSIPPIPAVSTAVALHPESIDSSPRSRHTDSWDSDPPPILPQKLRFMCSYGGHIIPRPHDKSLCYIFGDTRIIVVDRHTSLSDFHHRISKTLLQNQPCLLKYQLPDEDLDALISVSSDEDLEIMVEEYDRLNNAVVGGRLKQPGRLRLFLFPKSASNIDQLLVESASIKSGDWFFNALNGKTDALSAAASDRGLSESSSVNCLLGLDDDFVGKTAATGKGAETQMGFGYNNGGNVNVNGNGNGDIVNNHEVHSPIMETTSSFGSASGSLSADLPPPKTGGLGIEEQFQQTGVGVVANVNSPTPPQKHEEIEVLAAGTVVSGLPSAAGVEYGNRAFSEDERSDHLGYRKTQQIQQLVQPQHIYQFQQRRDGVIDFPSPDSVSSEGSITNPLCKQRQATSQEPITQILSSNYRAMAIADPIDRETENQNTGGVPAQPQVQESVYLSPNQFDQNYPQLHQPQQFVLSGNEYGTQYIPAGAVPIVSYYPMYPPEQQFHPHQPELDQRYPVYLMTARPPQAYNSPLQQPNYSEMAPNPASTHPQTSRNVPSSKLFQVPSNQQQLYVGYTQIHHPSQSRVPTPAANANYTYEFADPACAQRYYTQPLPPQLAARYQTMASGPAAVLLESSPQLENIKH